MPQLDVFGALQNGYQFGQQVQQRNALKDVSGALANNDYSGALQGAGRAGDPRLVAQIKQMQAEGKTQELAAAKERASALRQIAAKLATLPEDQIQQMAPQLAQALEAEAGIPAQQAFQTLTNPQARQAALIQVTELDDLLGKVVQSGDQTLLQRRTADGGVSVDSVYQRPPSFAEQTSRAGVGIQQQRLGLDQQRLGLDAQKFQASQTRGANGAVGNLTEGQKALDRAYAKEYQQWRTVGQPDVQANVSRLQEVRQKLATSNNLTGPIAGLGGAGIRSITNPESANAQQLVEEVVQRNLRLILGAQFTQKEGDRLIERAYNPRLQEAENIKRVDRLLTQIEQAASAKEDQAQYFEQNGTLTGWQGHIPTLTEIERGLESGGGGQSPSSAPRQISGAEDYAALPPGAEYIDPNGVRRRKAN